MSLLTEHGIYVDLLQASHVVFGLCFLKGDRVCGFLKGCRACGACVVGVCGVGVCGVGDVEVDRCPAAGFAFSQLGCQDHQSHCEEYRSSADDGEFDGLQESWCHLCDLSG